MRTSLAAGFLIASLAACSTHDHVTDGSELVDTWNLVAGSGPDQAAMSVTFKADGKYQMVQFDGSPATGSYEVQDPLLIQYADNPVGTTYCTPKVVFSSSDNTLTFSAYDPTACMAAAGKPTAISFTMRTAETGPSGRGREW